MPKRSSVSFCPSEAVDCMPIKPFGKPPRITVEGFKYVKAHPTKDGIVLQWGYPGVGFGEVAMWVNPNWEWNADTECMGPDFCAKILAAWFKGVKRV